jgi:hypothetical protein
MQVYCQNSIAKRMPALILRFSLYFSALLIIHSFAQQNEYYSARNRLLIPAIGFLA